mmetsp:Transcript_21325/g.40132  ORF Transcript_21325/g.40132 Transcript_21325/m.40132 type:complete len:91 (+) Transcript_21325:67-339(+)
MGVSPSFGCSECREPMQIQLYYLPSTDEADHEFMVLAGDRERRQPFPDAKLEGQAPAGPAWKVFQPVHALEPRPRKTEESRRGLSLRITI